MNTGTSKQHWTDWLPGLRLLFGYDRSCLPRDLTAGLVVALVLIPSAIAYADLAKCSPIAGLYAGLGGMIAYALFTSSRHVIVGPDAAIAILVGAAVGPLAEGAPGQIVALSTWLALLAAMILLLAAWLRLGGAADFLSTPVMLGFMNGAAVVIIVSQLGKLSGISLHEENTLLKAWEWVTRLTEANWLTVGCGLSGIAVLAVLRWWQPGIPGTVVIFGAAIVAGRLVDFSSLKIAVIGPVDTSMPLPVPPELSLGDVGRLVVAALGLAMLIFPEGILLGRAMAEKHNYEIEPNRELVALGVANLATGLLRSFSVGGSQSRTLLNSGTGGRTQMVSFIAAGLLVAFVVFLASWIATLPTVAIAAILIFTGLTLIDFAEVRRLQRLHRYSASLALITSIGVIAFGVLPGILVGVLLSLLKVLSEVSHPQDALLGRTPGELVMHDLGDDKTAQTIPGLVVYRFYGPLVFANIRFFIDRLERFIARETTPVREVIVDARAITEIDVTAADQLSAYVTKLRERNITFVVAKATRPLRKAAARLGLRDRFTQTTYFPRLSDAVATFERKGDAATAGGERGEAKAPPDHTR